MAYNTYDNPKTVVIGSTSITGVQSITVNVGYAEVHASADDDAVEGVARFGTATVRGSINGLDPTVADTVKGSTGTFSFVAQEVKGGTDKICSIANASLGGYDATVGRDAAAGVNIPFIAEALPGWA